MARALLLGLALLAPAAQAARFEKLEVGHQRGTFTVRATIVLEAPLAAVRAVLTDFDHLDRLSPAIVESRLLRVDPHGPVVFTRTRSCVGWFCRDLRRTEEVTYLDGAIVTTAIPEQSNVVRSVTRWELAADGARRTRLGWSVDVDPKFFVPPLIGPPLIKGALKREGQTLAAGIERAAQAVGGG
jgi:hypothetical protein